MNKSTKLLGFLVMFVAVHFYGMAPNNPPPPGDWSSWTSKKFNDYIKIQYRDNGKHVYQFKLFKKDNVFGTGDTWIEIDHFTISPTDPDHSKKNVNLYPLVDLKSYEVVAHYDKGNVKTNGKVTAPDGTHSWDTTVDNFSTDHVDVTKEGEYYYDAVSEFWRIRCSTLPCGPWVTFPGYGEAHGIIKGMTVNGKKQDVLVQVWKGYCPRFMDVTKSEKKDIKNFGSQFPGGIGAEVGLYTDVAPTGLSWNPLVTDDVKIAFKLVNRKTGEVVVDAKEEATWWKTKWMTTGSYDKYKQTHDCPADPMEYDLQIWINGLPLAGTMSTWNWSDGRDGQVKVQ